MKDISGTLITGEEKIFLPWVWMVTGMLLFQRYEAGNVHLTCEQPLPDVDAQLLI